MSNLAVERFSLSGEQAAFYSMDFARDLYFEEMPLL
jgi:hypothetical protein